MTRNQRRELLACGALVAAVLFWAGNAVLGRGVVGEIPPVALSFWRWVAALALLLPLSWRHLRSSLPAIRQHLGLLTVLGVLSAGLFNTLLYGAAVTTSAINITLINASMPIVIALTAWLTATETLTRRQALGLGIALPGVIVVVAQGSLERLAALSLAPGDLLMVLAITSWAIYSVLLRRHPLGLHPLVLLTALVSLALPFILACYLAELALGITYTPQAGHIPALLYVAVFPSILSYLGWNYGVQVIGPGRAGMFMYLMPLFAAALALPLLGERLHGYHGVGAVLILLGLYLATLGARTRRPEETADEPESGPAKR